MPNPTTQSWASITNTEISFCRACGQAVHDMKWGDPSEVVEKAQLPPPPPPPPKTLPTCLNPNCQYYRNPLATCQINLGRKFPMPMSEDYIGRYKIFKKEVCAKCKSSVENFISGRNGCCQTPLNNGYPQFDARKRTCLQFDAKPPSKPPPEPVGVPVGVALKNKPTPKRETGVATRSEKAK